MCVPLYWEHTSVSSPLTGGGSVCLHTQIHTPAVITVNRGYPAAIAAAGHPRQEHRTSYDIHPDRRGVPATLTYGAV